MKFRIINQIKPDIWKFLFLFGFTMLRLNSLYFLGLIGLASIIISNANGGPLPNRFLGLRHDLYQGDMKLTEDQLKNGIIGDRYRWPGGVLIYELDPSFTQAEKNTIAAAMADISSKSCVTFREKTSETDYVYIIRGAPGTGCWAYVGRLGGRQELNLEAPGCINNRGPGPHELMHAVGFHHEHARQDRDEYVRVLWENIDPSMYYAFDKVSGTTTWNFPYDYLSIMQYPAYAFSMNGEDTIEPYPDPNAPFGPYDYLSVDDGLKINTMYNGFC